MMNWRAVERAGEGDELKLEVERGSEDSLQCQWPAGRLAQVPEIVRPHILKYMCDRYEYRAICLPALAPYTTRYYAFIIQYVTYTKVEINLENFQTKS